MTSIGTTCIRAGIAADEHAAPTALTVDQAHSLMQVHLECTTEDCGARGAALTLLVAERRYVLDLNVRRR